MAKISAMNRGDCGHDWQFCKLIHDSKHIVIASHIFFRLFYLKEMWNLIVSTGKREINMFRMHFVKLHSNIMLYSIIIIFNFTYFKDFNEYGSAVTTNHIECYRWICLFERFSLFKNGFLSSDDVTEKRISSVGTVHN